MIKLFYISAVVIASLLGPTSATAQTNCQSDGFGGMRCNDGGGWQSDGFGGTRGTGNNSGRNCQSDGFGGLRCN